LSKLQVRTCFALAALTAIAGLIGALVSRSYWVDVRLDHSDLPAWPTWSIIAVLRGLNSALFQPAPDGRDDAGLYLTNACAHDETLRGLPIQDVWPQSWDRTVFVRHICKGDLYLDEYLCSGDHAFVFGDFVFFGDTAFLREIREALDRPWLELESPRTLYLRQ
jgi:hypothetical protein